MKQPLLCVSGKKNSGKTTLMEKLVSELTERGVRVAVVKHVQHGFTPDHADTDSWRFRQAGAWGVAAFDDNKFMVVKAAAVDAAYLVDFFPEADLVLVEGGKSSSWPKLELVLWGEPVCDPATVIAYVSDQPLEAWDRPVYSFSDIHGIVEMILRFLV